MLDHPPTAWIATRGGRAVDLLSPDPASIHLEDIAHALSHLCRFTGHTERFYSVAEHSVLMSYMVPPSLAVAALMHDAAEAYLGDVSAPLKSLLPKYRFLEARMEAAIHTRLELPELGVEERAIIRDADLRMLKAEQKQAMGRSDTWTQLADIALPAVELRFWTPSAAFKAFMRRAVDLEMIYHLRESEITPLD
jgi:uncharacterized protein